jgi:hypothetical protein
MERVSMSEDIVLVARALDFAARKHRGQKRKGELAEPYVNHLAEVARLVAEATGGRDALAVVNSPPADWPATRRRDYALWAAQVVLGCRGVNAQIEARFDEAYARASRLVL